MNRDKYESLITKDEEVGNALSKELDRQEDTLTMIASENNVSEYVMKAQGSELTNKYAEGYPDSRYYAGCENADTIEKLAIKRAKELWGAEHVNVQPHSGTQANQAVYLAELEPGDTILSLKLSHGGHLSHGSPVNFTGQIYDSEHYEVDIDNGKLDYDSVCDVAEDVNPELIVSGFSAYPREVNFERMQSIAEKVNATHVADIAHITGLIASGHHQNPVGVSDYVTGSTHKTIRSGKGGIIMTGEENAEKIDKAVFPGSQGGPSMHSIAGKAVGFGEALEPSFNQYIEDVISNCRYLSSKLQNSGFELVSGGTDIHLVLIDFQETHPELTGKKAESALEEVGIIANKNTVPGDQRSPFVTSGLRLGTPSLTTRGFDQKDMDILSDVIIDVLNNPESEDTLSNAASTVSQLCSENRIYGE